MTKAKHQHDRGHDASWRHLPPHATVEIIKEIALSDQAVPRGLGVRTCIGITQ
jgi:hypothetical protein